MQCGFGFVAVASAIALAGCQSATASRPAQPDSGIGAEQNWTTPAGDADESAYSRLTSIDSGNVGKLGLAWSMDLPGEVGLEATPIAVNGVVYFTGTLGKVYAVDGATGRLLWSHDPEVWKHNPLKMHFTFGANRGVSYDNGKLFAAALDGRLYALDPATGKELWSTETTDPKNGQTITGAPRVFDGMVIIGQGGADFGMRGYVSAYDQQTGKQVWRFYVVPGDPAQDKGEPAMAAALKTWSPDFWKKTGGGGGPWGNFTFDKELNRIYVGTGNASPYQESVRSPGGGDNLYTSSIVALDAKTGKYLWHYQVNPGDSWDYDNTQQMTVATMNIAGKPRKVLMQSTKNGFFYVIDRLTGKLVNAPGKTTRVNWATGIDVKTGRPIEEPNIRYENGDAKIWPGSVGGHDWQAMSYSPRTGLVYLPVQQIGAHFYTKGQPGPNAFSVMGLSVEPITEAPGDGKGYLVAWDPVAQKARWTVQNPYLWNGGAMATAGNVVFQGTADGYLNAYDAGTGKRLWRFNAGLGIVGAPMSYKVGDKQYVSVLVGYGGTTGAYGKFMNVGWKYGQQPRRILTFALGANGKLAPTPGPDFTVHAVDDPALKIDPADVAAGGGLYIQCAACHGVALQSTGSPAPDLRESSIALDLATFSQFVKQGNMPAGMPSFAGMLTDQQLKQLHAYIRAGARAALGKSAPAPHDKSLPPPVGPGQPLKEQIKH